MTPRLTALRRGLVIGVLVLATFWGIAVYAGQAGVGSAARTAAAPWTEAGAVIYSRQRLQISGDGVQVVELDDRNAAYGYRYNGLRLLAHTNSR